jgi:hypothetical protein
MANNIHSTALWQAIQDFSMDEIGVAFPFSQRLARENGWETRYTRQAIEEYKRFIYLVCIAPHPITPSEEVDMVWHLHLVYTKSYWDEFCEKTLRQKIHHTPTQGGNSEREKFYLWYNKTLELYESTFGQKAPEAFWPPAQVRFSGNNARWIDLKKYWVFKKLF